MSQARFFAAVSMALLLAGCAPEHSTSAGFLEFVPEAGYRWEDQDAWFKKAVWEPGQPNPNVSHIRAAGSEGYWEASPGYKWRESKFVTGLFGSQNEITDRILTESLEVVWTPKQNHPDHAHVISLDSEGGWGPEVGYRLSSDGLMNATWAAGSRNPDRPHYIATASEGRWALEPGYTERSFLFSTYTAWTPGLIHPSQTCLVSAPQERVWRAVDGYHLVSVSPTVYRVEGDVGPTDWGRVIGGVLIALAGAGAAQPNRDDGLVERHIVQPIAKEVGKAGAEGAINAVGRRTSGPCSGVRIDFATLK